MSINCMSKSSSTPALTLAPLPPRPLQYVEPISLRNDRGRRSVLTFVKGSDIIHHLKAGKESLSCGNLMHIRKKDYSNLIIYIVCFTFLFLQTWFVAILP